MAYPILGTPKPTFLDNNGDPLVSGTITITDPDTSASKDAYGTAAFADAGTNGFGSIIIDSLGQPSGVGLWGRDGEDYTIVIKDSGGSTIVTMEDIRLPIGTTNVSKVKTADESLTTTTLADDTHLLNWTLNANTYYKVTGYLLATAAGATQDLKVDFVVDNALQDSSYTYIAVDAATAGTVDAGEVQAVTAATTIDIDSTSDVGIIISGFLFTHATSATNLDIQVAQGTDAGTTTLKNGSWIKIEPLVV